MAEEFATAVDDGLRLSKRLYFGKDRAVTPPRTLPVMDRLDHSLLPKAPMVYAVINDPGIVDNPDIPSYQPHVHGRCDPPALIPLQMNRIQLEADCYMDTAFVRITGSWRVHCVMGSRSCDCRIAIPMGEQGSVLGLEIDAPRKSYRTSLIALEDSNKNVEKAERIEGGFLTPDIYTLTIPQVDGGSNLSINISWSQKLLFCDGDLTLNVPFTFPEYVIPAGKKMSKKEKIAINVNAGTATEVLCKTTSHPLKELTRQPGKLSFVYEAEVLSWSRTDLNFSYSVSSSHISGSILLQSPSVHDVDQREMFCMYLHPGNQQGKVFRKRIIFLIDVSGSMGGKGLDDVKDVLSTALCKLHHEDTFNIIAFNEETHQFSASMEMASKDAVERAVQWIKKLMADGGTNILLPLTKATEMLSSGGGGGSIPIIFLVTDGAVEDERHICEVMRKTQIEKEFICPRIYTFGIGTFCNHYFLRMLAIIGRGQYDAAYDPNLIKSRMQKLYSIASHAIFVNIAIDALDDLDEVEVSSSFIPDLSSESLLRVSGRYRGNFPQTAKAKGLLSNLDNFVLDLKVKHAKDIPLDRILTKERIEQLTAQAWFSENKQLEEMVGKMSLETGVMSEYTRMVLLQSEDKFNESTKVKQITKKNAYEKMVEPKGDKMMLLPFSGIGFGNLVATTDNTPPGVGERKPEAAEMFVKAASSCCGSLCSYCCCPCCIQVCSSMNNQCATVLTQLCTALACFGCMDCCLEMCCSTRDMS